jgi:hypothetical protein
MKMKLKTALATAIIAFASVSSASAAIIAGSTINTVGNVAQLPTGGSVDAATGLDFLGFNGASGSTPGTISVGTGSSGSFNVFTALGCPLSAAAGGCGTIQDILDFATFTPIASFYTIIEGGNTLSFDLNTLSVVSRIAASAGNLASLTIAGTGTFLLNGTDSASGVYTLSTQGNGQTTFSASSVAVPEPGSLALLGIAGLGFALVRWRKWGSS